MRWLSILMVVLLVGCQSAATTEINRPAGDVNGSRTLRLSIGSNPRFFGTVASVSYVDGATHGFGPGVLLTCNSIPLVDTRKKNYQADTSFFIGTTDTAYDWFYSGPDTTFEFSDPSLESLFIVSPRADTEVFLLNSSDSLPIIYQPTIPCTNVVLSVSGESLNRFFEDTLQPPVRVDTSTGEIAPIPVASIDSLTGSGQIWLAVVRRTQFSLPSIHSVVITDSSVSEPNFINWVQ